MNQYTGKETVNVPIPYKNLRELLEFAGEFHLDVPAYIFRAGKGKARDANIEKNYLEFKEDIDHFATGLLDKGIVTIQEHFEEKEHIAIIGANSYPWLIVHNAVLFGLGVSVPLDKQLADDEVSHLCLRGSVTVFAFDYTHKDAALATAKENPNIHTFILIDQIEKYEALRAELPNLLHIENIIEDGKKSTSGNLEKYKNYEIKNEEAAAIYYTSGTTNNSKGVMLSQKNIISNVYSGVKNIPIPKGIRTLSVLPIHHTFEATVGMYCLWAIGVTICINDNLRNFSKNLKDWKIGMILGVPLIFSRLQKQVLKTIEKSGKSKSFNFGRKISKFLMKLGIDRRRKLFSAVIDGLGGHLQFLVSGAAALSHDTHKFFDDVGITILPGYGLTETSPMLAACVPGANPVGSVGKPLYNNTVAIDSPDGGNSPETAGEIFAKGDNIMLGYYNNEEATKEAFTEDGWFKTGDIGYFSKDHTLYITGRAKSLIVLNNGKKVFPEEIELQYSEISGIKNVMIWAETNERGSLDLSARFQVDKEALPEELTQADDDAISNWLDNQVNASNQKMTEYKKIRYFIWNEEDPIMTTTMKVKRKPEVERIQAFLQAQGKTIRELSGKRVEF